VLSRHTADRQAHFLEQARSRASAIKQSEAAASERRLTRLQHVDLQRERAQAKANQEAKVREKSMLSTALAIAAVVILAIVIATLIIALRG
jgi:subtilase family serine protease